MKKGIYIVLSCVALAVIIYHFFGFEKLPRIFIVSLTGIAFLIFLWLLAQLINRRAARKRAEEIMCEHEKIRLRRERIDKVFAQSKEEGWGLSTLYRNLMAVVDNIKPEEVTVNYIHEKREKEIYPDARFIN